MPLKSSVDHYGAMPAALHWLTALAILFLLVSGQIMDGPNLGAILPMHVALGLSVGALTLFRIAWFVVFDRHPKPVAGVSGMQHLLARFVHIGLYAAILVMVASGMGMVALSGAAQQIFGGGALPDFTLLPPFGVHGLVSKLLLVLALFHIGAALWHHFVVRDGLIGRMGFRG
ncbi:cytochrome b [Devosia faecipullorum]|uniref:cytochrome b n=1 Tax=Devosia faecipullorum TaxID=2755039 RepID=UPI00187B2C33|nr:cytochrome b/b6 domain-containing protein [Devosia faecipullorum]MBE7732682.1 cytochrome b [Devosia faecipullorum]